jgi:hypothetical protein
MKKFLDLNFDLVAGRRELAEFGALLAANRELREREQIQPFFEQRLQLSASAGSCMFLIGQGNRVALKFPMFGDFEADLVVGNSEERAYCLVEFEDGGEDSVFSRSGEKATREWSRRFEHGFSQLVDWFYLLDDMQNTQRRAQDFGYGETRFHGLLVIGRSAGIGDDERNRLLWRSDRVVVNSHKIDCLTYDDLYHAMRRRIELYSVASEMS